MTQMLEKLVVKNWNWRGGGEGYVVVSMKDWKG